MKGSDILTLFGVGLVFAAGIIVGQGFSFEVKLSDLITLTATIITFVFARNGLKHNENQYLNSIKPILNCHKLKDEQNFFYTFSLKNSGTGPANKITYKLIYKNKELSAKEFNELVKIHDLLGSVKVSTPSSYGSLEEFTIIEISSKNFLYHKKIYELLNQVRFEVKYHSLQEQVFHLKCKLI